MAHEEKVQRMALLWEVEIMALNKLDIENLIPDWLEEASKEDREEILRMFKGLIHRYDTSAKLSTQTCQVGKYFKEENLDLFEGD